MLHKKQCPELPKEDRRTTLPHYAPRTLVLLLVAIGWPAMVQADFSREYPRDGRYCNYSTGEGHDGPIPGPFFMLDMAIASTYYPQLLCELDARDHQSFWRSYYRYYGCTPESEIGQEMERMLQGLPERFQAEWSAFQAQQPDAAAVFCEKAKACKAPAEFDPATANDEFQCQIRLQ